VLWEALDEWKQTGRPYVVSMGGVAASGGYYVSAGADRIFAEPGTITGSIGVVGMKIVLEGAMEKLGITSHTTQRGKVAGMQSMTRGFTEEEAGLVRQSMEEVYGTFKKRVTDGRGKSLKDDLDKLAGGRVYSGKDALAVGLVDELGGLSDAIIHARRLTKLEKLEIRMVPEPKDALSGLLAKPEKDKDEIIRAGVPAPGSELRAALVRLGVSDALPAALRREITRLGARLEAFQKCRVLMLGPDIHLNF
ncbi:MAG: S49 family peptidase, partial [Akkermansiaceae bacterium]|nr:S49 family peptidase [Akkermansiaceae bacterium]